MISVNFEKLKVAAHEFRRLKRSDEFAPLDYAIAAQLPNASATEAARQAIREKYAVMQQQIDAATTYAEIKTILEL